MTSFDYIILAIVLISSVIGLLRGFLREVLSLIAYIAAFMASIWWGPVASQWLVTLIDNGLLRTLVAYGVVFILALLSVGLVNMAMGALVERTGLTPADHGLGAVFGAVRGLVLVLALVGLAGYTELPREPWWQEARTAGALTKGFQQIKLMLPTDVARLLPY